MAIRPEYRRSRFEGLRPSLPQLQRVNYLQLALSLKLSIAQRPRSMTFLRFVLSAFICVHQWCL
jgi:hypothetical protein